MANFTPASIVSDVTFGLGLLSSFGKKVDVVGIYANANASGTTNNTVPSSGNTAPTAGVGSAGSIGSSITNALGGSNIINSFLGKSNNVADFGQMFVNARPMKATVRETSRVMEHPVETGVILADHHIINPVEIDLPLIIMSQYYAATYTQIRQNFINATPLTVKTRTGSYQNMIIADMPHEEDPEMYTAITMSLHLKQVLFYNQGGSALAAGYQPLNPNNSNTTQSGLQQGVAIAGKLLTSGLSVASYASVINKKLI